MKPRVTQVYFSADSYLLEHGACNSKGLYVTPANAGVQAATYPLRSWLPTSGVMTDVLANDETFMALARVALAVSPEEIGAGDVWVATMPDERIAGMVALAPGDAPNAIDLDKLFVEPQRIRSGAGAALLAHAVAEARRRGARRVTILSDPHAAPFYERHGAIRIGEAPSDAVPGRLLPLYEIRLD